MKTIIHKAESRGHYDHGWLQTYHTFSFANYYDPERVYFGALRVINDDHVAPGMGFETHSHSNMEIISIPLHGILEHKDSTGTETYITKGQIQVMSAGTGIFHSEHSARGAEGNEFLQIWILPDRKNVIPRYVNKSIETLIHKNQISEIVYPYPGEEEAEESNGLWIHQQAWLSIADLDEGALASYHLHTPESYGVYVFIIEGVVDIAAETLEKRDGMGISDVEKFDIKAIQPAKVLLIEVPPFLRR